MELTWKFFLAMLIVLIPGPWLNSQEEPVKEKVEVVNVEVPVRIFLDGAPVAGLTRDDFQLFEGKEKQDINGFYVRKKKLAVENMALKPESGSEAASGRYFVLVFRLVEFNDQMKKGVDYFFEHILRDNDQLLAMVNDRTLELNRDVLKIKRQELLNQLLQEEAAKARQNLEILLSVQKSLDQNKLSTLMESGTAFSSQDTIIQILENYLRNWNEFKDKYLVPDLDKFYNFARHLEKIKKEKWVLNFYQIEMLPKMKNTGPLRRELDDIVDDYGGEQSNANASATAWVKKIKLLLAEIDRGLDLDKKFPAEQISKMLLRVDATYYCFISSVERKWLSENFEYKNVASEFENSLREITRRSGGVTVSGDIDAALHAIAGKEDGYYVLTYAPPKPESHGKIMIKVNDARYRLLYDDNSRSDYIAQYLQNKKLVDPTIQVHDLVFKQGKLHFNISDFRMIEKNKKISGRLKVAVRISDSGSNVLYDRNRVIDATEKNVSIDIGFDWLKPGKYMFLVEVRDLLSDKTAMDILQATAD